MNPTMLTPVAVAPDTTQLPAYLPVPGFGVLPVNAYVIHGEAPVLVDTGLASLRPQFMAALRDTIDLGSLEWIWLTHVDPDHAGNLAAVLDEAPRALVVTTFLGMGKMGLHGLPLDRVHLLNPGQRLVLADRHAHGADAAVVRRARDDGAVRFTQQGAFQLGLLRRAARDARGNCRGRRRKPAARRLDRVGVDRRTMARERRGVGVHGLGGCAAEPVAESRAEQSLAACPQHARRAHPSSRKC